MNLNLDKLLLHTIAIAKKAGEAIQDIYDSNQSHPIIIKQDQSPQIIADRIANQIICDELKTVANNIPIISEESALASFSERQQWEYYWLVDPLDGSKEFIKRNGEFTVNIALIHQHRPVLGVVHLPVKHITYFAGNPQGAYKQSLTSEQPISISNETTATPVIVVSHDENHPQLTILLNTLGPHSLMRIGSSIKICLIAEGKADLYPRFFPTNEWDTAAAHCILLAAGGEIYEIPDKIPLRYNNKASLINPSFFACNPRSKQWLKA